MRKLTIIFMVLSLAAFLAVPAFAGEHAKKAETKEVKAEKQELKEQTNCPVMGGKINKEVYTDIQGQRVYHCCPGCSAPLKKDPDKYFQKAAAEGVLFENIQTTCPVSGKKLDKKEVYLDYEGRRIYFCCEGCPREFKKKPEKFLSAMDNAEGHKAESKEDKMKGHEGHKHEM